MERQSRCSSVSGILVKREVTVYTEDRDDNETLSRGTSAVSVTSGTGQASGLSVLHNRSSNTLQDDNMSDQERIIDGIDEETTTDPKGEDGVHYLVELFRQPPPPGHYSHNMSTPDSASISSRDGERRKKFKLFRKSRKQEEPSIPPITLPDSAVPSTTIGGHRHIAISVPSAVPEIQQPVSLGAEFNQEMRKMFSTPEFAPRTLSPIPEEDEPPSSGSSLGRVSRPRTPWESMAKARLDLARVSSPMDSHTRSGSSTELRQDELVDTQSISSQQAKVRGMRFYEQRATQGQFSYSNDDNPQSTSSESSSVKQKATIRDTPPANQQILETAKVAPLGSFDLKRAGALRLKRASFDDSVLSAKRLPSILGGHLASSPTRPVSAIVQSSPRLDSPPEPQEALPDKSPSMNKPMRIDPESTKISTDGGEGTDESISSPQNRPSLGGSSKTRNALDVVSQTIAPVPDIDWMKYPVLSSVAQHLNLGNGMTTPPTTSYGSKWQTADPLSLEVDTTSPLSLFQCISDPRRQLRDHTEAAEWASRQKTLLKLEKLKENRLKRMEERLDKLEQQREKLLGSVISSMESLKKLLEEQNTLLLSTKAKSQDLGACPYRSVHERQDNNGPNILHESSPPSLDDGGRSPSYGFPSPFIRLTADPQNDGSQSPKSAEKPQESPRCCKHDKEAGDQAAEDERQRELEDGICRAEALVNNVIRTATAATQNAMQQYKQEAEAVSLEQAEQLGDNTSETNSLRSGSKISTYKRSNSSGSEYSDRDGS